MARCPVSPPGSGLYADARPSPEFTEDFREAHTSRLVRRSKLDWEVRHVQLPTRNSLQRDENAANSLTRRQCLHGNGYVEGIGGERDRSRKQRAAKGESRISLGVANE